MIRLLMLASVVALGAGGPALALGSNSTMADWSSASAADRKALLESMGPSLSRSFQAEKDDIMACIDRAAEAHGHSDLLVSEIAKACAEAARPDENANPSTDI